MNSLPVIVRELRSEARNPMNYWLRVLGAAVMLLMAAIVVVDQGGNIGGKGNVMFGVLQPTFFSLVWLLAPIMTCDCISRERREGTLGLLLLTPLRPVDVGVAKALSGMLRSFTLILAILPIVAIPLLLGGVTGQDLLRAAMMEIMALIGAISAGLLASGRCREFSRAALLSLLLSALMLILLGSIQTLHLFVQIFGGALGGPSQMPPWVVPIFLLIGPWVIGSGIEDSWQRGPWATSPDMLWLSLVQVFAALGLLFLTLLYLNRNLRKLSVETGMTQRQVWWWKTFCTPRLFKRTFRRVNRSLLDRNPIGWLQRRTWTARVATWGWLGFLVAVETFLVTFDNRRFDSNWNDLMDSQPVIAAFLAVGIAFSAANSFRKERETGALELLLVTPLSARQIIMGRLFGLWGQYLPAYLLLIGALWYTTSFPLWRDAVYLLNARLGLGLIFTTTFTLLPVIGLNESLSRKHFFTAWLTTASRSLAIPILAPFAAIIGWNALLFKVTGTYNHSVPARALAVICVIASIQAYFAFRAFKGVHRHLAERRFALSQ